MAKIRSSLQANQLLAGLQIREPKLYDLIRSIIKDLEDISVVTEANQNDLAVISAAVASGGSGLNHQQVMRRISEKI